MKHILGIDVIPTKNEAVLNLFDTSFYSTGPAITCSRLEITVPGYKDVRLLEPAAHFNLAINAITLELINPLADFLPALPDGLYHVNYSISPNQYVFIEFDFLRTVCFDKQIMEQRMLLDLATCAPSEPIHKKLIKLGEIEDYAKAATAAVDYGEEERGIALFAYAKKLLDRLSNHS